MFFEEVQATVQKFDMLDNNDRIVVAVSGGADSVALLHALIKLKTKFKLYLHIAHLNHQLRKNESLIEREYVEELAQKLSLPITYEEIKVKEFAQREKLSLEEAARKIRYDFFLRVADKSSAKKIALGHNWNDQAETVLMRFLRGSGLAGLRGIPPKRKLENCQVIRPLIETDRKQIISFLASKKINYCTDSSNLTDQFFRNKVRNKLIPLIEREFNQNINEVLVNFAENIAVDFNFLEKIGQKKFQSLRGNSNDKELHLNISKFSIEPKALQKLVVRLAIKQLKGNVRQIDFRHWKEIEDLVEKRPINSIVDLPGKVSVVKKKKDLCFYSR